MPRGRSVVKGLELPAGLLLTVKATLRLLIWATRLWLKRFLVLAMQLSGAWSLSDRVIRTCKRLDYVSVHVCYTHGASILNIFILSQYLPDLEGTAHHCAGHTIKFAFPDLLPQVLLTTEPFFCLCHLSRFSSLVWAVQCRSYTDNNNVHHMMRISFLVLTLFAHCM